MIVNKIETRPTWDGGAEIVLKTTDRRAVQALQDKYIDGKKYVAEIKQYRAKRSLDANAYCWVLCRKLADVLNLTDVEVYKQQIRHYGLTVIKPEKAELVDDLVRMWDKMGVGNAHDLLGDSKIAGYVNVKYYYGSSQYDSKRMARLIDGLIEECKLQEIETMPPDEIERIKQQWATG